MWSLRCVSFRDSKGGDGLRREVAKGSHGWVVSPPSSIFGKASNRGKIARATPKLYHVIASSQSADYHIHSINRPNRFKCASKCSKGDTGCRKQIIELRISMKCTWR